MTRLTITEVQQAIVTMPLVHAFQTSSHRKGAISHIVLKVTATDGVREYLGWGECASPTDPFFSGETTQSCWDVLERYLVPMTVGRSWSHPSDAARLSAKVKGNPFARAGLDMACWDVYAQSRGSSLADILAPDGASAVPAGVSLGIESSIDELLQQVAHHTADGYRRVKLKVQPGWDAEPVAAVRDAFPDVLVQVDGNGAYTRAELDDLTGLDRFGLLMIEQPFAADDLLLHAELAARLDTPICLDESITSVEMLACALALRSCRVVNIKVSRLGGIRSATAVHDRCLAEGIDAMCGGMHEFGIGRSANLAVASLPGFTLASDISASDKYYETDVGRQPIRAQDGMVPVPRTIPGLGVCPDEDFLTSKSSRRLTTRS